MRTSELYPSYNPDVSFLGIGEFDNAGALMNVEKDLTCSFQASLLLVMFSMTRCLILLFIDIEASRQKVEISLRRTQGRT